MADQDDRAVVVTSPGWSVIEPVDVSGISLLRNLAGHARHHLGILPGGRNKRSTRAERFHHSRLGSDTPTTGEPCDLGP